MIKEIKKQSDVFEMSQHIPYYDLLAAEMGKTNAKHMHEKVKAYIGKFC